MAQKQTIMQVDVLIAGGGSAGLTVAALLNKKAKRLRDFGQGGVAVIEPSPVHYYQPLWTLVGGGVIDRQKTVRPQKDLIPDGVQWIQDSIKSFLPNENRVELTSGQSIEYRYLVVALGLQLDWDRVAGLKTTIGRNGVCSNYSFETVSYTWQCIKQFQGGRAVFTFPNTPVKCGGAPQKIMYLAEDYFRRNGVRGQTEVCFYSAGPSIFHVAKYAKALDQLIAKRGIKTEFKSNLVAVNGDKKEAVFENVETGDRRSVAFDLLHVTPPMSAPSVLASSALAGAQGWVDVDKHSLQHRVFSNVFCLGDASNLPTSKTGAAIRKQSPVLVANLLSVRSGEAPSRQYDGYTSCPLVTGYGKLILAEFGYDGAIQETFPFDQSKERLSMYLLKKYALPLLYWQGMLKGRA